MPARIALISQRMLYPAALLLGHRSMPLGDGHVTLGFW
jgi:hypothetical protein